MIARIWHGRTKACDADAYVDYLYKSGIPAYRATTGNRGAWVLRRTNGDVRHFITLSFWESRDAIVAFAGDDIDVAKYYPEDKKYLLEFEPTVTQVAGVELNRGKSESSDQIGLVEFSFSFLFLFAF
jgi:heme-degrading monooxygenase HmoA